MATRCPSCFSKIDGAVCPRCGYPSRPVNGSHQLPVSTVLRGRYQLGRVLGQGGFGITYLAWDKLMRIPVAVKEFYPGSMVTRSSEVSTDVRCIAESAGAQFEAGKSRFLREASALVDFKEIPAIVDILDYFEENNTAYIVMEFIRGVSLEKYIQRSGGKLSADETFRILKPVMEALAQVHESGIIHRDISPDNIMLDPMGGAKILDFGAVRSVENPDVDGQLDKSTQAILKHGFAPMEQYHARGTLGPWTDEYALCGTIWYCLTGEVPPAASLRMTENANPDWSTIPGLTKHQQKVLTKGFSSRPKERFSSVRKMMEMLFAEGAPTVNVTPEEPAKTHKFSPKAPEVPVHSGGNKLVIGLSIALGAVAAILVAAVLVVTIGLPALRYAQADKLLQDGMPEEAAAAFLEMEDYKDSPQRYASIQYTLAEDLLSRERYAEAAMAFSRAGSHLDSQSRARECWDKVTAHQTVAAGSNYTVALTGSGTVVAAGANDYSQCEVGGWSSIVSVSASYLHTVGLDAGGKVFAVGYNAFGQCDVAGWADIVAVSAGGQHTVGLKADGTVVAIGNNANGQCDVDSWEGIIAISAGSSHTLGLKANGTVVAVGSNSHGQCDTSDWEDIVAIAAGSFHSVGLKADGTVVAIGCNDDGQCNTATWSNVIAISAGDHHTVGLKEDGTLLAKGSDFNGQCNVAEWTEVIGIAAGGSHTVAVTADGTALAAGLNREGQCEIGNLTELAGAKSEE